MLFLRPTDSPRDVLVPLIPTTTSYEVEMSSVARELVEDIGVRQTSVSNFFIENGRPAPRLLTGDYLMTSTSVEAGKVSVEAIALYTGYLERWWRAALLKEAEILTTEEKLRLMEKAVMNRLSKEEVAQFSELFRPVKIRKDELREAIPNIVYR